MFVISDLGGYRRGVLALLYGTTQGRYERIGMTVAKQTGSRGREWEPGRPGRRTRTGEGGGPRTRHRLHHQSQARRRQRGIDELVDPCSSIHARRSLGQALCI